MADGQDTVIPRNGVDRRREELARRVLEECRVTLMLSFRFLDAALWKLPLEVREMSEVLATDGHRLFFCPVAVLRCYRADPKRLARTYLHTVLHCIFRQPFRTVRTDPDAWSFACDVCVETVAIEMCGRRLELEDDERLVEAIRELSGVIGSVTPAKVYRLVEGTGFSAAAAASGADAFAAALAQSRAFAKDGHELWDLAMREQTEQSDQAERPDSQDDTPDGPEGAQDGGAQGSGQQDSSSQDEADQADGSPDLGDGRGEPQDDMPDELPEGYDGDDERVEERESAAESQQDDRAEHPERATAASAQQEESGDDGETAGAWAPAGGDDEETQGQPYVYEEGALSDETDDEAEWERIAQQVEAELQTLAKERGDGMGNLMSNLHLANRSNVDYEQFLRRFSVLDEDLKLNDEEFDYIFYTYGLTRYGNMPLIEPLEYKEDDRIREFVIAIDTSASCSGELVRIFLTRTYEILSCGSRFGDKVNIHVVQCDAKIQHDEVITNTEQLRRFERGLDVQGNGGTDFRPVFSYVNQLLEDGEFSDLRGLVYFTDGFGVFPEAPPDYEVAFVFVEGEGRERRVPPWAMKVVMNEEDIEELSPEWQGLGKQASARGAL